MPNSFLILNSYANPYIHLLLLLAFLLHIKLLWHSLMLHINMDVQF